MFLVHFERFGFQLHNNYVKEPETILKAIVQSYENLGKFPDAFQDAFKNSLQYRHFQAYMAGLMIHLVSRNLVGLSRAIPDGKSACASHRFVAKMYWDT
jgi:hypothetical protein